MKTCLILIISVITAVSWAQVDPNQVEVRAVIDQLFDGMRAGDSTMVRSVFHAEATAYTSYQKEGVFKIHSGSIDEFVGAVGSPHEEVWDERISNVQITIDGGLAQVWMDYAFYLDERLSHVGVNAFHLVKTNETWKIIHLVDTRRSNT